MIATIERSVLPGVYVVRDSNNRQHRVHSPEFWRKGQSVLVADGHITGLAVRQPVPTRAEV